MSPLNCLLFSWLKPKSWHWLSFLMLNSLNVLEELLRLQLLQGWLLQGWLLQGKLLQGWLLQGWLLQGKLLLVYLLQW